MPLIYLNCPKETFSAKAKNELAEHLTNIALEVEGLPKTPFVKSTVWIYFNEYPPENVYHGAVNTGTKVISLEINAFKGGLDVEQKKKIIEKFTESIRKHAEIKAKYRVPVYIIFRDVPESDWGVFGGTIRLEDLKNPPINAEVI
jgi:phenylpyruvate tautomerase PptA (4-oxalocrotonate tautomerase family)